MSLYKCIHGHQKRCRSCTRFAARIRHETLLHAALVAQEHYFMAKGSAARAGESSLDARLWGQAAVEAANIADALRALAKEPKP